MGGFDRARRSHSEVKLYDTAINIGARDGTFSASKARSVARTASIEIETSDASAVRDACCSIVAGV